MPSVTENLDRWQHHPWALQGDEWSPGRCAEGTVLFWHRTILPRILQFVPSATILEIGPGFGRWTQFLRRLTPRLIVVDLSARCIAACRERFADDRHLEYFVNDGSSLDMIGDSTVDFLFSCDSLVHVEADAIGAYVRQAARILAPGGVGFIHHSNLGAFVHPRTGRVRSFVTQPNWRAESMSAATFRRQCDAAGLHCRSQELVNWIGRGRFSDQHRLDGRLIPLTDCFSVIANEAARTPTTIVRNPAFVEEWRASVWMIDVYGRTPSGSVAGMRPAADARAPLLRKIGTARTLWRRNGIAAVVRTAARSSFNQSRFWMSAGKSRLLGAANRWFSRRLST